MSHNTREMDVPKLKINNLIKTTCDCGVCYASHSVSVTDIEEAIKHIKSSKSDGSIPGMSDYVVNSTKKAAVCSTLVFNSCLLHGFVPEEMLLGTSIPIPINKHKSLSESSNYRGTTLSSIIDKLYDFILFKMKNRILFS